MEDHPRISTQSLDGFDVLSTNGQLQDKKTVVLFLPFYGGSARTFKQVITQLNKTAPELTCMALSYPGTGPTEPPQDDTPEAHSIEPRARQLLGLFRSTKLGQTLTSNELTICAHSMSTKIAYLFLDMLTSQNDMNVRVKGLILTGPAPVGPLVLPEEIQKQQHGAYSSTESARWVIENVLSTSTIDPRIKGELAEDCAGMTNGAKGGWLEYGMAYDCTTALHSLKTSTPGLAIRILVGSEDKVEAVERVTQQTLLPLRDLGFEASLSVIDGCGHLLPLEAPSQVANAVLDLNQLKQQTSDSSR